MTGRFGQMTGRFWFETLGCPKNEVDSEKLVGALSRAGMKVSDSPEHADVVVVNTCAFIEAARQESVEMILELASRKPSGARLVVTGCMAERYGDRLAAAMPEVDLVAGFGRDLLEGFELGGLELTDVTSVSEAENARRVPPVAVAAPTLRRVPEFDLLELPRSPTTAPWAYVKVAEGCDRRCAYCAIPTFRGPQRSRSADSVLAEVHALGGRVREVVLVAQDLASWRLDRSDPTAAERRPLAGRDGTRPLVDLVKAVAGVVERVRLLYLYPSSVDEALIEAVCETGVPYFDLSLQHVSRPLLKQMSRPGDRRRFTDLIGAIRSVAPDATLRSNFIVGFPGETEEDHDELLGFLDETQLDWGGFFTFSEEDGTPAASLPESDSVPRQLASERLRECSELQDAITARRRQSLVGSVVSVLLDADGAARSYREAPEIDGIVNVPHGREPGTITDVLVTGAAGPDLWAEYLP